jgi:Flp pilus assembly protein TadD
VNNLGSYHLVKEEFKAALKYYDKVLKKSPSDQTARQNALLAARRMKNVKAEKKYLNLMVRYGSEKEKTLAQVRLDSLGK